MRRWQLAILLGVACFLGTDSAEFAPLRAISPVTCLGFAPEIGEGFHHRVSLGGGESHCYRLELEKGDAVRAIVWQQGVDVKLGLHDPGGAEILKVDSPNWDRGFEALFAVAEQAGAHELQIGNLKKNKSGAYEIRIEKVGPADRDDQLRADAQRMQADSSSIEALKKAISLWRQVGDPYQEALALRARGVAEQGAEHFREALKSFQTALELSRRLRQNEIQVVLWNHVADARYELHEQPQAIIAASIALRLARSIDHVPGQMVALSNLGVYQAERNNFAEAIKLFHEALRVDVTFDHPERRAITLHNLGHLQTWLGRLKDARDSLEEALELLRSADVVTGQIRTLIELGRVDYLEEDFDSAIENYETAHVLARAAGRDFDEAGILDRLGTIYRKLAQYDLAERCYLDALQKLPSDVRGVAATEMIANLGSLYAATGRFGRALELLSRARSGYRKMEDRSKEADVSVEIARVLYQLGDTNKALSMLAEALRIVDQLRLGSADYSLRESFLAVRRWQHEAAIDLLMQLDTDDPKAGHAARAFEVSERARSRSLLDMLHEKRTTIRATADPKLLAEERELSKALAAPTLETDLGNSPGGIEREKRRLGLAFEEVGSKIRNSSPVFRDEAEPQPLGTREIQRLLDDETVLLAYTLSDDRSFLWLVERGSIRGFRLPPRRQIETLAKRYFGLLTQPSNDPGLERRQTDTGKELTHALLGQVAAQLGRRRLVFLLDGALHAIPIGTLPDPAFLTDAQPPPLLANHEIDYLPSASVLPILRERLTKRPTTTGKVAIFADAVYSLDDDHFPLLATPAPQPMATPRSANREMPGSFDFSPLPGSRAEAEAIRDLVGPLASLSALGFAANRETLLATDFSRYQILHLAVHGVFDENPWFSGVVLSTYDEHRKPRDGALMLHEIYQLDIPVELVVLSACETARGKEVRGEGIIGLPRGFLYAGAARVMVSLWKVDDEATAELMTHFYQRMIMNGETPATALRWAQLELRETPRWRSPRYWAGFVLQGAW